MLPSVQFLGKTIALYGLMILLGILLGVSLATYRSKKYNIKKIDVIFSCCYAGIGLILGAKLLYLITILPDLIKNYKLYLESNEQLIRLLTGGFVFYGGILGALSGFYIYTNQYGINFIGLLDLVTPSVPIMHSFGRIGCFFAGCCYGIKYQGPFSITFLDSIAGPNHVALFPIQLLESFINVLVSIFLIFYSKKDRLPGKIFGIYLMLYSLIRFFLEFLRGDIIRGKLFGITTSQWISLLLFPIGYYCYKLGRKVSS